jgi:hypothetical protein
LDGLTGGASDAGTADDGSARLDAASSDASPSDASPSSDTSPPFDGGPNEACAHDFCDDFDDGGITGRWTKSEVTGGVLTIDSVIARSPPSSLHASVPAATANETSAALVQIFPGSTPRMSCAADFYVDQADPKGDIEILNIVFDPAPTSPLAEYQAEVNLANGALTLYEFLRNKDGGGASHDYGSVAFALGQWHHLTLETTMPTVAAPTVTLTLDSTVVGSHVLVALPERVAQRLQVGVVYEDTVGSGWQVHVDNVTCDLH